MCFKVTDCKLITDIFQTAFSTIILTGSTFEMPDFDKLTF
jgi:hypothetical protein